MKITIFRNQYNKNRKKSSYWIQYFFIRSKSNFIIHRSVQISKLAYVSQHFKGHNHRSGVLGRKRTRLNTFAKYAGIAFVSETNIIVCHIAFESIKLRRFVAKQLFFQH